MITFVIIAVFFSDAIITIKVVKRCRAFLSHVHFVPNLVKTVILCSPQCLTF